MITARSMPRPFSSLPPVEEASFSRLVKSIDPDWIDLALESTGTATIRRRRLPAEQVIWLVLGMALYRRRPIDELVQRLDLVLPNEEGTRVARSTVAQARARLGDEPLQWLFNRCANKWGHESARRYAWRGLAVYGVDGTTARVPDSTENRAHFGGQTGRDGLSSGYPIVRIVTLMALRSHVLAGANFGPLGAEQPYAKPLWDMLPDASLAVVDRNFLDAKILIPIARDGKDRHWLTRAKSTTAHKVFKKLGMGDHHVELAVSPQARAADATLPKTWIVRAIQYQRRGFKPQLLLTSMLDQRLYPAKEVIELYHERWEIELGYDEVKTDLLEREETIRSKTPKGVAQELWAIALLYNLIRLEMERISIEAEVMPSRISFRMAMRLIQDEWMWLSASDRPGAIPRHLRALRGDVLQFVLPPRRSKRVFPRAVKIKMSNYDRKRPTISPRKRAK